VLDVSVGLNEEPERIVATLKEAAEAMRNEARWQNIVLEPLDVMGVEKFVDMAWVMRVRMKTQPSSRWAVSRELNRRFKATFDALGIESPITSNRALSSIPPPPAAQPEGSPA
jgi:small conductance mechanosensitive channel